MADIKFNINDSIKVKLKPEGVKIWKEIYTFNGKTPDGPRCDEDGYVRFQLWDFMQMYGPHTCIGAIPPYETEILICTK